MFKRRHLIILAVNLLMVILLLSSCSKDEAKETIKSNSPSPQPQVTQEITKPAEASGDAGKKENGSEDAEPTIITPEASGDASKKDNENKESTGTDDNPASTGTDSSPTITGMPNNPADEGKQNYDASGEINNDMPVELIDYTYKYGDNITAVFPEITGMTDTGKQDKLNELIKNEVMNYIAVFKKEGATAEVKYETSWLGKNLLSIKYTVYSNYPGAAHPNNDFFTANVNLNNAEKVKLTDVLKVSDYFVQKMINYASYTGPLDKSDKELQGILKDELKNLNTASLKKADSADESAANYSYFTRDSLGISLQLPFVAGGYALYEIKYEDIISYLYYSNEIWKDFPEILSQIELSGNGEEDQKTGEENGIPLTGTDINDFIPKGFHLFDFYGTTALETGDLNWDGIEDAAFIIEGESSGEVAAPRYLVIVFKNKDNTYSLSAVAKNVVLRADQGGAWGDPFENFSVSNGTVTLSFYGGSTWRWGNIYQFQYLDGDWYLTGASESFINIGTNEGTQKEYNLLTGNYSIKETSADGKEKFSKGNFDKRNKYRLVDFVTGNEDIFDFGVTN